MRKSHQADPDSRFYAKTESRMLTYELLVNLSADEFARIAMDAKGLNPKDILLMITRFEHDILKSILVKDGEKHERYIFFNRVLRIMYMALQAEEQINFWKNVAVRSKMEMEFHKDNAAIYFEELMKYKTLEEVINAGDLDKYITEVKERQQK